MAILYLDPEALFYYAFLLGIIAVLLQKKVKYNYYE